jgi:hypothetical protein
MKEGSVREERDEMKSDTGVDEKGLVSDFLRTAVPRRQSRNATRRKNDERKMRAAACC